MFNSPKDTHAYGRGVSITEFGEAAEIFQTSATRLTDGNVNETCSFGPSGTNGGVDIPKK